MSKTTYVLDANVLLYDPESLYGFPDSEILIPVEVIEEIDQFKKSSSEVGNNARTVSHLLDRFRNEGNLAEGIALKNQSTLRVEVTSIKPDVLPSNFDQNKASNRVLSVVLNLQNKGVHSILVTQDINVRVKANVLGIPVTSYEGSPSSSSLDTGFQKYSLPQEELVPFQNQLEFIYPGEFLPHEGLLLEDENNSENFVLARFDEEKNHFSSCTDQHVWGIKARNPEQRFAFSLLMDPRISIVSLIGKAGTGKTLLALAVGLQMMLADNHYNKLLVSRPVFPMGRDLGYLPGDLQEKLSPWMQPIFDNLELLIGPPSHGSDSRTGYHELIEQELLVIEPLTYIHGRSIPNQYMIIDEAQNLTPHEIKTIITRAGEGTKIVLTGDPFQIDNPYINTFSNGLSYAVKKFKNHSIAGHVTLNKGERSKLAELAANIL